MAQIDKSIKTMMNLCRHLKLGQRHFSSDSQIHYSLQKNQLIKYKVKINVYFVKKIIMKTQKINFYIVDFVDILLAKFVVINKENSHLQVKQDNHLSSNKESAVKFVIGNFHKN